MKSEIKSEMEAVNAKVDGVNAKVDGMKSDIGEIMALLRQLSPTAHAADD